MNSLLLIIDLQKSFINNNTVGIIKKIENLLIEKKYDNVIFTKFINTYDSIWYNKLNYSGCLTLDEQSIVIDIDSKDKVIDKTIYSAFNDELKKYIIENNIDKIYLCGIDTECCVLKTAFDLFENGYDVYVLKDYCACTVGIERHNNAIEILKRNIGYDSVI